MFEKHTISPDGYNIGRYAFTLRMAITAGSCRFLHRDGLVAAAKGTKSFNGVTYSTTATTLSGVMPSGTNGVNHGEWSTLITGGFHADCKM